MILLKIDTLASIQYVDVLLMSYLDQATSWLIWVKTT